MLPLTRRPNWEQRLRDSSAIQQLKAGRPDRVPLADIQKITDDLIDSFKRRGVAPFTEECDVLLVRELEKVKNELGAHEAGIISCLHVLSYGQARGQLLSIRPDPERAGVFFKDKLPLYLQCLIIAKKANRDGACSDEEADAARELFNVAQSRGTTFPTIWRLLHVVGKSTYEGLVPPELAGRSTHEELLPIDLVERVLRRNFFQENLTKELDLLRQSRGWYDAYKIVYGLRKVVGVPRADELLREIFPDYPMWSSWRPNHVRLKLWDKSLPTGNRERLFSILDLEGPDLTGQQRGTLRISSPGIFKDNPAVLSDRSILDRLLVLLDRSISLGPSVVNSFTCLCVERQGLTPNFLERVDAALGFDNPLVAKDLLEFIKVLAEEATVHERTVAFTKALPMIQFSPRLQRSFSMDLERKAPETLTAAQKQFCRLLQEKRPSERFSLSVHALGRVMLDSVWLHEYWHEMYIDMLRQLPSEGEIKSIYRALEASQEQHRQGYIDLLASKVGGSRRRVASDHTSASVIALDHPIWYDETLDIDRMDLRSKLRVLPGIGNALATLCLERAIKEHDSFVRELNGILLGDTDLVCVNLAYYLGSRMAAPQRVNDCWKSLLLQMMRQRPPGLLERCGRKLLLTSWLRWVESLRRLYKDKHLDPDGGLGFTEEKFAQWTQYKVGIGRSLSTSTISTVSTVSTTGTGRVSFVSAYMEDMK